MPDSIWNLKVRDPRLVHFVAESVPGRKEKRSAVTIIRNDLMAVIEVVKKAVRNYYRSIYGMFVYCFVWYNYLLHFHFHFHFNFNLCALYGFIRNSFYLICLVELWNVGPRARVTARAYLARTIDLSPYLRVKIVFQQTITRCG